MITVDQPNINMPLAAAIGSSRRVPATCSTSPEPSVV